MSTWQRLRASARKVVRQNRQNFNCIAQEELPENTTYVYNLCLTWCLRRTLLNHARCTIPELDHFIYNFTHVLEIYLASPPAKRGPLRSSLYFNSDTAWPWMQDYLYLKPCDSAQSFRETFEVFEMTFFPRGDKFAMNASCGTECPPDCVEYHGLLATEGTELHPATERIHGVTVYFNARVEEIHEKWKYTISQLLIDISGVMSFLLGLSLVAIHEWCFILIKWLVERSTFRQGPLDLEPAYLRDELRYDDYHEYDDDYYRDGQQSPRSHHSRDYDYYYDDYGGEYDSYDDYGEPYYDDYGDESFDYAGDEKVLDAAHSGIMFDQASLMASRELHTKSSHLAP
ncbi:uncharacterized protein LOC122377748 [Amphibalanus amphitrite]|uniref:uncharacterized protein LOC122377748 n=1 Tax=Amphibalanus amphitrite TaxID=1232801 RepID=UPI001C926678|nr:uncharacterized protein LOC122377748 [Amphibalanus amphitrite]XP_043214064.1 uncharacterized protein LOC122377748 [Amphibalanus amphitrite]XP_043214065.1 uncharacterized protein LOC122377748 [Amphibalanus amphitrite]